VTVDEAKALDNEASFGSIVGPGCRARNVPQDQRQQILSHGASALTFHRGGRERLRPPSGREGTFERHAEGMLPLMMCLFIGKNSGSSVGSGPRGRRFKSSRPDQSHPQEGPRNRAFLLYRWFR